MDESRKRTDQLAQSRRRSWFVLTLGIGLMVLAVVGMVLVVRTRNASAPQASVDRAVIDLGTHPYGEPVRAEFRITNTGGGTLEFVDVPVVEVVEGC